eukprot:CAMPEP_0183587540 /NCGR_PEP_ID=MMETSP0371-20130417/159179_1 /TAXON_ID=268820 /ORGANISM="Peridinium aciculiferum, Strain PAER-2" /LENGTH=72 /DNA_ID=CAMNT_0025798727 /DNA_START=148 /DNA_END=363 /DNA_ORIENTATION=-
MVKVESLCQLRPSMPAHTGTATRALIQWPAFIVLASVKHQHFILHAACDGWGKAARHGSFRSALLIKRDRGE